MTLELVGSGVSIVDRPLYIPRRSGGILTVPSFERLKTLVKRTLGGIAHLQLGNAAESDLLKLFFQNTAMANVGNAAGLPATSGAGSPGSIFVALHTSTGPGAAGTQTSNESAYPNYARVGVARSAAGWTVTGSSPTTSENAVAVTFPQSGSGGSTPETQTYFSTGSLTSTGGEIYWFGALTANLIVNNLITPSFAINQLTDTLL